MCCLKHVKVRVCLILFGCCLDVVICEDWQNNFLSTVYFLYIILAQPPIHGFQKFRLSLMNHMNSLCITTCFLLWILQGAYFAETSCLADKYSPAGGDGLHVPWPCNLQVLRFLFGSTNYGHNTVDGRNPAPCWYGKYPIIYRVSYMLGGCLGFQPSTVWINMMLPQLMDTWTTCSFKLWQLLAEAKLSVLLPIPKGRLSKGPKINQYEGTVPSTFQWLYNFVLTTM